MPAFACNPLTRKGLRVDSRAGTQRIRVPDHFCSGGARMKVRPLQDRVIVRRVAEEEKTKGGIIIPDSAKEKPAEAEVVAIGNGKVDDKGKLRPLAVKKGDRVLFGKYTGNEIKIDGVDHLILREDDILGVLEK